MNAALKSECDFGKISTLRNKSEALRPISRGQPLIQLHATDYDANENGELRFAFAEDSDSSLTSLFAIHPFSGLVVSKYSLQPKDLEFLGQVPLLLKQTHTLRIRVSDLGTPSLASYAILRLNFQVRSNHALEAVLPSLREQQILQQQHPIDLFDEYGGVAPEVETPAQGTRKNDLSFFVLCAFFVFLLLLFLAVLLFIVLNRRPECLASVLCPTTITTTTETRTHRLPLAPFVSPLCHENRNCQSGRTLTQSARITPCHNLQQTLPLASVFSESGASSPESSAV
ncbi:unnamed protein product [Mesocestoides corti]|uniref:Cadherin domain-containing protein n=1 Tax=Mesocestoides corti TaxID=53468 RepID=A0A0R3UMC0_MESCO|nr:unnamed protein product [Mesocestoides corti]